MLACVDKRKPEVTPWGTVVGEEQQAGNGKYSLDDIIGSGEMIALTISGPDTYYDYHGHGMGVQYMMCENFAREIGVTLRVELCRDSAEMVRKLKEGYGDVVAVMLPKGSKADKG